jgi:hypothetical protein
MDKFDSIEVEKVFNTYPTNIRKKLLILRQLILDTAADSKLVKSVEETLKWGEPSYVSKIGSTIRLGRSKSTSGQYAIYFHCQTTLVDTFKELYKDQFNFEGNRAIVFNTSDELAIEEIKHCILLSLTYHKIKHLPLLGV